MKLCFSLLSPHGVNVKYEKALCNLNKITIYFSLKI